MNRPVLVIHGGAGARPAHDRIPGCREGLARALNVGRAILVDNGTALDAVEAAVAALEDDPNFNAGTGAVSTENDIFELDAAIMCGRTLHAGSLGAVRYQRNPIRAARRLLDEHRHVLMCSSAADQFAAGEGLEQVTNTYFRTNYNNSGDTVGAVALDRSGNLAAGTSTGGRTGKRAGRIGDSGVIGAGNYANNQTVAVSCSGDGELFQRAVSAYDVHARILYGGASLKEAASAALTNIYNLDGTGGIIAVSSSGEIILKFNTEAFLRAAWKEGQEVEASID